MNIPEIKQFNLRVYALILEDGHILLSDEFVHDMKMTKFPGGGLYFGEGTADCLKREAMEEFGQEIEIIEHYYTTHFFQQALFYEEQQLISIYYLARFPEAPRFRISEKPFDFPERINESQSFRWARIPELSEEDLSFSVDRFVLKMLKSNTKPKY
jgi:ADP-ribose pyrophosphatase YjhB (NUDIX family)